MSVKVFKDGDYWHYRFQIKPFARVQRSTRLRNEGKARVVAEKAYNDAIARANGGDPVPTLRELLADWLVVVGQHSSPEHVRSVETFGRLHMYGMGALPISQLDTDTVERCVPGLPVPVLAAFADAVFNLGPSLVCSRASSTAARMLYAGDLVGACNQLPRWDKARLAGVLVALPGLTKRRAAERSLCLTGVP